MRDYELVFRDYLRTGNLTELRAAANSTPPDGQYTSVSAYGGYLVPPAYLPLLTVQLKAFGGVVNDFTRFETPTGAVMTAPYRGSAGLTGSNGLLADVTQVAELDAVFGNVSLGCYVISSGAQVVSLQLEQDSAIPIEQVILPFIGESIGRAVGQVWSLTGTGSSQPQGVNETCNTQGAWSAGNSGGYIALGTATPVEIDGAASTELAAKVPCATTLRTMMRAVDAGYRNLGAKWYVNDNQLVGLLGQTDTTGQPLIRPNGPLELWGFPIVVDPNIPDLTASTTTGPYFGHLGSAMYYRDAGFEVLRLRQRYADFGQVGFIGYHRMDTRPRDPRAVVGVKASTS